MYRLWVGWSPSLLMLEPEVGVGEAHPMTPAVQRREAAGFSSELFPCGFEPVWTAVPAAGLRVWSVYTWSEVRRVLPRGGSG